MKTVVALFDDFADAKKAAQTLEGAGFSHGDISIVANNEGGRLAALPVEPADHAGEHVIGRDAVAGAEIGGMTGLFMAMTAFAVPGFGWMAGAGWLMAVIFGAGTGAIVGSFIGALTTAGVTEADAAHYSEGVRRGGTLLAVKAADEIADRAAFILGDAGAINIDERAKSYGQDSEPPTASSRAELTRARYYDHSSTAPGFETGEIDMEGPSDKLDRVAR